MKTKYVHILNQSKKLANHFHNTVLTQRELADAFAELARTSPDLIEELTTNAEIQRSLIKNGEILIGI